jgi:hypothetical protein
VMMAPMPSAMRMTLATMPPYFIKGFTWSSLVSWAAPRVGAVSDYKSTSRRPAIPPQEVPGGA